MGVTLPSPAASSVNSTGELRIQAAPYRADPTGTDDASDAINTAIEDANATWIETGVGQVVRTGPGRFTVESSILLLSGVALVGDGPGNSTIAAAATLGDTSLIRTAEFDEGIEDSTVANLEIDGNKVARGLVSPVAGLVVWYGSAASPNVRVSFRGNRLHHAPGIGGAVQFVEGLEVVGNEIHDNGRDGFTCFYTCNAIRYHGNWIHDCGDDLIGLNAETSLTTGNVMKDVVVTGNVLGPQTSAGSGISVRGVSNFEVAGNVVIETHADGIEVSSFNTTDARDGHVHDNVIVEAGKNNVTNAGSGVGVYASLTGQFTASGVGSCHGIRVEANTIIRPRLYGVVARNFDATTETLSSVTIKGNRIEHSTLRATGEGIFTSGINCDDLTIDDNDVSDSPSYGIHAGDGAGTIKRLRITRNRVRDSGKQTANPGIYATGVADATIALNRSTDTRSGGSKTQTYGLRINNGSGRMTVFGNNLTGNATADLNLTGTAGTLEMDVTGSLGLPTVITDPTAPTSGGLVYVKDNGSGKTQLAVRFPTGAVQILATEP